jgi:hypothetical protein
VKAWEDCSKIGLESKPPMSPQSKTHVDLSAASFCKVKVVEKRRGMRLLVGIHKAYPGRGDLCWTSLSRGVLVFCVAFEELKSDVLVVQAAG